MPAVPGAIGELIEGTFYAVSVPNNSPFVNIGYVDVPPGDWDVSGNVVFIPQTGDCATSEYHVTTGTNPTSLDASPACGAPSALHANIAGGYAGIMIAGLRRYVTTQPSTRIYLQAIATFTSGKSMKATGYLRANRAVDAT